MSINEALKSLSRRYDAKQDSPVILTGDEVEPAEIIPSSIPAFNYVAAGGFPVNRVIEFYGNPSALKSYLCYDALAKFQQFDWANKIPGVIKKVNFKTLKKGQNLSEREVEGYSLKRGYKPKKAPKHKYVCLVDIEGTYDKKWGQERGVDTEALLYFRPSSLSKAVDIIEALVTSEEVSLVVIDSMVAVGSDAEQSKSMEDDQMAANPRFWNRAVRKLNAAINKDRDRAATILYVNSMYDKVGLVFGNPEQIRNGVQLKLAKSLSVKFVLVGEVKDKSTDEVLGRNIRFENKKCKYGTALRKAGVYYALVEDTEGIPAKQTNVVEQAMEIGLKEEIITRKGNYYTFDGHTENGAAKFVAMLTKNAELLDKLLEAVQQASLG